MAGFTAFLATAARRSGVIGWPLTGVAILFLLVFASAFFMPLSPPLAMIGFVFLGLVFGVAFLVKSRKA
jgi:membrane protein YqaA with SNARE-associated domain